MREMAAPNWKSREGGVSFRADRPRSSLIETKAVGEPLDRRRD
jgi:hypothetical protein